MLYTLLILRLLHITAGVFWAGSAIYTSFFILPAARSLGPEGGKFMRQLSMTNNIPVVMNLVSSVTVLSGLALLWIVSGGFRLSWLTTLHGLVITGGGILALSGYVVGFTINRPTIAKMSALNRQIALTGIPTEDQKVLIQEYTSVLSSATFVIAILLMASVVAMSVVRYL
jgi:hypothetical protein